MKTTVFVLGALMLVAMAPIVSATDTDVSVETVTVHSVDFRGKPPFRRSRAEVPVSDVAKVEPVPSTMVGKRRTDFRGRPPFARNSTTAASVDIARLDVLTDVEEAPRYGARFSGRSVGPRGRVR